MWQGLVQYFCVYGEGKFFQIQSPNLLARFCISAPQFFQIKIRSLAEAYDHNPFGRNGSSHIKYGNLVKLSLEVATGQDIPDLPAT